MKIEAGKFACDACGKRYTWKPQLAGKRAKCSCGATMVVPQAEGAPQAEESDDLYGFAEDSLPPATVARSMPVPAAVAAPASTSQPIGYRSAPTKEKTAKDRFAYDEITQPMRDLYTPVALIILGLLGIIAWATYIGAGPVMISVVSVVTGIATVIKTAVLIALAFWIAPLAGISFGDLRTAILKFAAIVMFTDACGYWFEEFLEAVGEIRGDKRTIRSIFYGVAVTATLITLLSYYLFDMDGEEVGTFAIPFALASEAIGWGLNLIVLAVIGALVATAATPPAAAPASAAPLATPAPGAPPGTPSPAAAPGLALQPNDRDRELERMIAGGRLTDAVEFNSAARDRDKREPQLVNQLYGAGAKRVYFGGKGIIVQLPDDAANRAKCFQLADAHRTAKGLQAAGPMEQGQRFLEFELDDKPVRPRLR